MSQLFRNSQHFLTTKNLTCLVSQNLQTKKYEKIYINPNQKKKTQLNQPKKSEKSKILSYVGISNPQATGTVELQQLPDRHPAARQLADLLGPGHGLFEDAYNAIQWWLFEGKNLGKNAWIKKIEKLMANLSWLIDWYVILTVLMTFLWLDII